MLPAALLLSISTLLSAQVPCDVPGFGLPAPAAQESIKAIAAQVSFRADNYSMKKLYLAMGAKNVYEDAQPLLPAEYLALKADERAKLLHPDTACLLVMQVCQAAAQQQPELAKTKDWLMPVLIRAQSNAQGSAVSQRGMNLGLKGTGGNTAIGGNTKRGGDDGFNGGPCSPLLEFRKNIPSADPTLGLDQGSRIVDLDRPTRNYQMQHGGKFPPMLFFCSDRDAEIEVQNWILARICIARVEGKWDSPERKQTLLKLATPLVPEWDPFLAERLRKCTETPKA
jgi:hypothetical protein